MKRFAFAVTALLATAGTGQALTTVIVPGKLPYESYLTDDGLNRYIVGHIVVLEDKTRAHYNNDGSYLLESADGLESIKGSYSLHPYGTVCVVPDIGVPHCETFVRSATKYMALMADGNRITVKSFVDQREAAKH